MALKLIFFEEFGKAFVPKRFMPNLRKYLLKAGFPEVPYKFFGFLFYISALLTGIIFITLVFPYLKRYSLLLIYALSFVSWFVIQIFFAILFILLVYFYLDLQIYYRTKNMEEQLPDFLELLSANLKGGMTFERALWSSVKPRFKILGSEMAKASKQAMIGYDVRKALSELSEKYDSFMLRRTVDLMVSEIESGGNVAQLIDRIVDNLRETKDLKDEMTAAAIAYVIFISVIVIVISPLLFALAFNLLTIILDFIGKLAVTTQRVSAVSALPIVLKQVSIDPEDFRIFSIITIFIISLFSSLIVAIVEKGDIKGGVKYIPIYVVCSMAFYFFFMKILKGLFVGLV